MSKKAFAIFVGTLTGVIIVLACVQFIGFAQSDIPGGVRLFATIGKDSEISGYFSSNGNGNARDWCVFVGQNGKVYKISLVDRDVSELSIDGQRVPKGDILKHSVEYTAFLEKYFRSVEIDNESRELDQKVKPLDEQIEALGEELEKLDAAESRLEKSSMKGSDSFVDARLELKKKQNSLEETQDEIDRQIESLSKLQDRLAQEQESLGLDNYVDQVLRHIAADLISLGVIKNPDKLSFKLSNRGLIVNGKSTRRDVFESLKSKYVVDHCDECGFLYKWKSKI